MVSDGPWTRADPLEAEQCRAIRQRAIFEFHKWDQQVGDVATFAGFPLVLKAAEWEKLGAWAELLSLEILQAEKELVGRPRLQKKLGLTRPILRALRGAADGRAPAEAARLMRFDFHYTTDGWRISEVNCDVPGGLNESSGYPRLMANFYPGFSGVGDTTEAYADALVRAMGCAGSVALVHATAYTDDLQVMYYVAKRLEEKGCRARLVSPDAIAWRDGYAFLDEARLDLIVRFFPAEWLPNLSRASGWTHFFAGSRTPISNPATAILAQSKRLPLVWDELDEPMRTWRALLPESCEPRKAPWRTDDAWIVKPALGRVGDGVGLRPHIDAADWKAIRSAARWAPDYWVAQRKFEICPVQNAAGAWYPCVGLFTIDGKTAGAYGRVARKPLIDQHARDAAVMVDA